MGIRRHAVVGNSRVARTSPAMLDPLEPRRLFSATAVGTYPLGGSTPTTLTDADGTVVKFSLPGGKGTVTVADDGWHVVVRSASSPFTVTAKGGDGRVHIDDVRARRPVALDATGARLTGTLALKNVVRVTLGKAPDLSLTSATPLASLTAATWTNTDSRPDAVTAPSIASLNVKRAFAPDLTLTSKKKVALNAATVGGAVTGAWLVAGSAGTLKFHAVRSPDLTIRGSVARLTLDDYVAVSKVASATGGVLHFGGKGSVSAARDKDTFQVARKVTLYTCTAAMYTWSELYQFDHPGRKWTMTDNGKKETSRVLPATQKVNGHDMFVIQDTGGDGPGTESYYVDAQGRGHAMDFGDSAATYRFSDLTISPAVYRLGVTTRDTSKASGHASEDGLSASFSGVAAHATRLVGHELVTTPAGTFLAAKIASTLTGSFAGAITDGSQSLSIRVTLSSAVNEYTVPGVGIVKYDSTITSKMTAPSLNESQTSKGGHHVVLTRLPVDDAT